MQKPFESRNGGGWRRFILCAGVVGTLLLSGCWQKMRTVHGTVRVNHEGGGSVEFDQIELAAYPKAVARNTFAQTSVKLGQRYTNLREEIQRTAENEDAANTTDGLSPAEVAVFKELRHLLEMTDALSGEREARDEINQRILELKLETKAAGQTRVVERFEKLAALHAQNVGDLEQLRHSAPKIGMLMLKQLPATEYSALADQNGKFSLRIPADEPYVLSAMARVKTRFGPDVYCWIVPLKLALGADVAVELNNENLFTDLNKTKQLVGLPRER